ncbi:trypsin-like serine protease [Planctomycetales bacterium ZRK34]|nr:trypsin-like serine protease [Planctomycetales bacterium ZRK34]
MMNRTLLLFVLLMAPAVATAADDQPVNLRRTPVVRVFQENRDAVVNVNTATIVRQRFGLFGDDPFSRLFDVRPFERKVKRTSLGSGFIIHAEGYIVTNAHVVEGADDVEVILSSGRHLKAEVLAADAQQDLAILKVDPPVGVTLHPVTLGNASDLMIGEPVVAIGNPLGYEHSVTAGIVSATNRDLPFDQTWELKGLIQTDASINPGNSGGPLLNAYGQVIGITSAIRGDAQNIGFAIPVDRLRQLIPEMLSPLAIRQLDFGGEIIEQSRTEPPAKITTTLRWQAAGQTEPGDVITAIGDKPVRNIVDAYVSLLAYDDGDRVDLSNEFKKWTVTLHKASPTDAQRVVRAMIGVEVRQPSAGDRAQLKLGRLEGVLITGVQRDGPADKAGLRRGDVIVQLGRHRISDESGLAVLLARAGAGVAADVFVVRDGRMGRTRLTLRGASL